MRSLITDPVVFPAGNIAPEGSLIKATGIDPSVVSQDNVYRHRGPARVFVSERDAIAAIKGTDGHPIKPNDVIVLVGAGPMGTGMEETSQLTSATASSIPRQPSGRLARRLARPRALRAD